MTEAERAWAEVERLRLAYGAALEVESVTVREMRAATETAWHAWDDARNACASRHPPETA